MVTAARARRFFLLTMPSIFNDKPYPGLIYYPHPETKLGHFQDPHTLEVISLQIAGIKYGDRLQLGLIL
jgi:hypothetical protein